MRLEGGAGGKREGGATCGFQQWANVTDCHDFLVKVRPSLHQSVALHCAVASLTERPVSCGARALAPEARHGAEEPTTRPEDLHLNIAWASVGGAAGQVARGGPGAQRGQG